MRSNYVGQKSFVHKDTFTVAIETGESIGDAEVSRQFTKIPLFC